MQQFKPIIDGHIKTEDYWGPECPDYEPGCACCAAWKLLRSTGRFPTDGEVWETLAQSAAEGQE